MSKIKEQLQRNSDTQMEYYTKFMDWMYDNLVQNQLSESDIDKLEEINSPNSCENEKISRFNLQATNNPNYYPPKGA